MGAFVYFKTKLFEWKERHSVKRLFYSNSHFRELDSALLQNYRKINPYQVCKNFLVQKRASEIYSYGETPLTTMDLIVRECEIKAGDTIIEMGSGRGRVALFLAEFVGCRVEAYEEISFFVNRMIPSKNLKIFTKDMFSADFSRADVVYLYGTMLADEEIIELSEKFPKNTKIITVSYPLNHYSKKYQTKKNLLGCFPWGTTEIYWNECTQ